MNSVVRIKSDNLIYSIFAYHMNTKGPRDFIMINLQTTISIIFIRLARKRFINLLNRHL